MTGPEPSVGSRSRYRGDAALAAGLAVAAIISETLYRMAGLFEDPAPGWASLLWAVGVTAPLAWRRRRPIVAMVAIATAFVVGGVALVPELLVSNIALFLAIYSVGSHVADRAAANLSRGIVVAGMLGWLVIALFQQATDADPEDRVAAGAPLTPLVAFMLLQIVVNIAYFSAAWYFGDRAFAAARVAADAAARRRELDAARERAAEQAVELDRMRIARELHDAVAHHVSVIGIQAGAARTVLDADREASRAALRTIETEAHAAIDELHGIIRTLRDADDGSDAAPLGVRRLPELVETTVAAGTPVSFQVVGEARPLPAVADANLYRIAQEALTNVRKHAGPAATADVRLRYGADHVELEIGNTGVVRGRRSPGGLGQLGMRERVAASGGTLEVGPRSRGGYLVRARLPVPAGSA